VRSIDAVVAHRAPAPGFYNVADDEITTWRDYYFALASGLGVDMAKVHAVPGDRYRAGFGNLVEGLKKLPPYRWLKESLGAEAKAAIKLRLKLALASDPSVEPGSHAGPIVARDIWHLQTTRYPLPTTKFNATFGHQNLLSFASGLAASLAWLRFVGLDERDETAVPRPGTTGIRALSVGPLPRPSRRGSA
jgi:hypothetical protein